MVTTVLVALTVLARAGQKKLIIDTNIVSAVDGVGALAVANVFHNTGDAQIVRAMVGTPSKWGPLAVSVPSVEMLTIPKPNLTCRLSTPTTAMATEDTFNGTLGPVRSTLNE